MTAASEASESGHIGVATKFFPFFSVNDSRDTETRGDMNVCRHVAQEVCERITPFGPPGPPPRCASVR